MTNLENKPKKKMFSQLSHLVHPHAHAPHSSGHSHSSQSSFAHDQAHRARLGAEFDGGYGSGSFPSHPAHSHGSPPSSIAEDNVHKFRQLPCRTFISVGTCPYRERCVYLHDPRLICKEAKTKTRRKNKEDGVCDGFFWPIMPASLVAGKQDIHHQPHVVQMYVIPTPHSSRPPSPVFAMEEHSYTPAAYTTHHFPHTGHNTHTHTSAPTTTHHFPHTNHNTHTHTTPTHHFPHTNHNTHTSDPNVSIFHAEAVYSMWMHFVHHTAHPLNAHSNKDPLGNPFYARNTFTHRDRLPVFQALSKGVSLVHTPGVSADSHTTAAPQDTGVCDMVYGGGVKGGVCDMVYGGGVRGGGSEMVYGDRVKGGVCDVECGGVYEGAEEMKRGGSPKSSAILWLHRGDIMAY